MDELESLSHTKWECKYHVVFIPKRRTKTLYVELRRHLGEVLRKLAAQKECRIEEGHLMQDHVHMMISIPAKYAVSQVVGYIKGKSAAEKIPDRRLAIQLGIGSGVLRCVSFERFSRRKLRSPLPPGRRLTGAVLRQEVFHRGPASISVPSTESDRSTAAVSF
jgi:REP element-mobilizing transposase RayT